MTSFDGPGQGPGPEPRADPRQELTGGTPLPLPLVGTLPANDVTDIGASLECSVNPRGSATTTWFNWGTDQSYGNTTSPVSAGSGSIPTTFGADIGGPITPLTEGQEYHYRAVAQSAAGTVHGQDVVFTAQTPVQPVIPAGQVAVVTTAVTALDEPHLAYPFFMTPRGARVYQQGSIEEVTSCVALIFDVHPGDSPQLPTIGIDDETFSQVPLDTTRMVAEAQAQEPRATAEIVATVADSDPSREYVTVNVGSGGTIISGT